MLRRTRIHDRLVALFVLGAVLLLPPLLAIFSQPVRVAGLPLLYLYLFLAWGGLIGMTAAVVRRIDIAQAGEGPAPAPGVPESQSDA
jgi:hypothetical protein